VLALLLAVGVWAGIQNALAGGGSFITLPTLILSGLDARAANIASAIALFPGQVTTGLIGRDNVRGLGSLSVKWLIGISFVGGVIGAGLLLATPSSFFAHMVPWLVLFATGLFAYGSFFQKPAANDAPRIGPRAAALMQFGIAVYGGYFGGGIGFLMLAALTAAGMAVRNAGATKNVLASVMNAAAVAVFVFTPGIPWLRVAALCIGAVIGGYAGAHALKRVDERLIRSFVVLLGVALTIGLFWQARR